MLLETPSTQSILAMRNREIRLEREREYWTEEEKEQLKLLFASGLGITEIAYNMHRTESAVYQQIENLYLYNRKTNPQRRRSAAKPRGCLCENCQCDPSFCPRCMEESRAKEEPNHV